MVPEGIDLGKRMRNERMPFDFKIVWLQAGWFGVRVSNGTQEARITVSHCLGTSDQGRLIRAAAELVTQTDAQQWVLWHGEPYGYIWHLKKVQEMLHYQIGTTRREVYRIAPEDLAREAIGEVCLCGEVSLIRFLRVLLRAFACYEQGESRARYEDAWGDFPERELTLARVAIQGMKSRAISIHKDGQ